MTDKPSTRRNYTEEDREEIEFLIETEMSYILEQGSISEVIALAHAMGLTDNDIADAVREKNCDDDDDE